MKYSSQFKTYFLMLLIGGFSIFQSAAQNSGIQYKDKVYVDYIKTPNLHLNGLYTSLPIIDLNSSSQLLLSFDDVDGGDAYFTYDIIHCDRNWQASGLEELEFLEGFTGQEIEDVYYSNGTLTDYTHYELLLPNEDIKWTISGNFVVAIYEDTDEKPLVLTRRFMVAENLLGIEFFERPVSNSMKTRTHQEMTLNMELLSVEVRDPMSEIYVSILKNGSWLDQKMNIQPRFMSRNTIKFSQFDLLNFPGGNEYRFIDLRSSKYKGVGVHSMDFRQSGIDVLLQLGVVDNGTSYKTYADLNGSFVTGTMDLPIGQQSIFYLGNPTNREESNIGRKLRISDYINNQTRSEYMNVIITLETPKVYIDSEVYVYGKLTDWQIKEEFKMEYDRKRRLYKMQTVLKQGFYDFSYALVQDGKADLETLEGSFFETENDYTVLVYYSKFGARYDRLIGVSSYNTAQNN